MQDNDEVLTVGLSFLPDPDDPLETTNRIADTLVDANLSIAETQIAVLSSIAACLADCSDDVYNCSNCVQGQIVRLLEFAESSIGSPIGKILDSIAGHYGEAVATLMAVDSSMSQLETGRVDQSIELTDYQTPQSEISFIGEQIETGLDSDGPMLTTPTIGVAKISPDDFTIGGDTPGVFTPCPEGQYYVSGSVCPDGTSTGAAGRGGGLGSGGCCDIPSGDSTVDLSTCRIQDYNDPNSPCWGKQTTSTSKQDSGECCDYFPCSATLFDCKGGSTAPLNGEPNVSGSDQIDNAFGNDDVGVSPDTSGLGNDQPRLSSGSSFSGRFGGITFTNWAGQELSPNWVEPGNETITASSGGTKADTPDTKQTGGTAPQQSKTCFAGAKCDFPSQTSNTLDFCNVDDWLSIHDSFNKFATIGLGKTTLSDPTVAAATIVNRILPEPSGWGLMGQLGRAVRALPASFLFVVIAAPIYIADFFTRMLPVPANCKNFGASLLHSGGVLINILGRRIGVIPEPITQSWEYAANYQCQYKIPSWEVLVGVASKGIIDNDTFDVATKMYGICTPWAEKVLKSQLSYPNYAQTFGLFRADMISEDKRNELLNRVGIPDGEDRDNWEKLSEYLPGPSDLIRMMVRDVADNQVVEKFQYDTDFATKWSGELEKFALRQNVPKDVAKFYWRAHWQLPSPTQLYEMLHRLRPELGLVKADGSPLSVTKEDVLQALKINDYAPYWVEALTRVSYRPLGLRQVGRAYETDVIDKQEAIKRYQDIGYIADDAKLLAEYLAVDSANRRADFLGLIQPKQAFQYLVSGAISDDTFRQIGKIAGLPDDNIETRIVNANFTRQAKASQSKIKSWSKKYVNFRLTEAEFRQKLQQLGIDKPAIDTIIDRDREQRESKDKALSMSKLCSFVQRGLISVPQFMMRAQEAGYSMEDATLLASSCVAEYQEKIAKQVQAELRRLQAAAEKAAARDERERRRLQRLAAQSFPCKNPPKPTCPPGVSPPPTELP